MRRVTLFLVLLAALSVTPAAMGAVVTKQDDAGRTITFDVRVPGVNVEWHAAHLRTVAHGDEIERVRFLILPTSELRQRCGEGATGCYTRGSEARIMMPAGTSDRVRHTLVHEYGHHLDAWRGVAAASQEPNGSASWWAARGMAQLLAEGKVSHTYSLGWERSIGEIYAEDYAQLHLVTKYQIGWLDPPNELVLEAMRKDLGNVRATAAAAAAAQAPPLIVERRGVLRGSGRVEIPFELLGPGRRATFAVRIGPAAARARMELRCGDGRRASRLVVGPRRSATIDLRDLGPGRCTVSLRNPGKIAASYYLRLRLAIQRPSVSQGP